MKILSLYIEGFGKLENLSLSFSDGLNVIYGQNEAGKSTLHNFLKSMLYGLDRKGSGTKQDAYHRFRPWNQEIPFGGELRFSYQNKNYLLKRDFRDGKGAPEIWELNSGSSEKIDVLTSDSAPSDEENTLIPIENPDEFLRLVLENFTETAYRNTISIGQLKSATGREMVQELRHYLSSIEGSGTSSLNADSALSILNQERKRCREHLVPDASKNYSVLVGEIRNLERELENPKYKNHLKQIEAQKNSSEQLRKERQSEKELLLQKNTEERERLYASGFTAVSEVQDKQKESEILFKNYTDIQTRLAAQGSLSRFFTKLAKLFQSGPVENEGEREAGALQEILSKQLGSSEISETSMNQLRSHFENLEQHFEELAGKESELHALSEEVNQLSDQEKNYNAALLEQYSLRTEIEGKLQHLSNIKTRAEQLEKVLIENEKLMKKLDALDLATETITELSERVRLSFGRYLNEEAGSLIHKITNGAYHSVLIDDQLHVNLDTSDGEVPLESVSSGTMDQIYLALRLAAARLLLKDAKEKLPLSFDDSFSLYDEKRLSSTLRFIKNEYDGQIMVFTCHKREAQLLKKAKEEFHYIELKKE